MKRSEDALETSGGGRCGRPFLPKDMRWASRLCRRENALRLRFDLKRVNMNVYMKLYMKPSRIMQIWKEE